MIKNKEEFRSISMPYCLKLQPDGSSDTNQKQKKVILQQAKAIADNLVGELRPFCDRIEIAGSIRRRKPEVKDIEIVCIPNDLEILQFIATVEQWQKIKGEATGKYTQRKLPEGINLDLFMANSNNWGLIFAMRTGSAEYSHRTLATTWVKLGYKSVEGMLTKNGVEVHVPEERDLFSLLGIDYIEPEYRTG